MSTTADFLRMPEAIEGKPGCLNTRGIKSYSQIGSRAMVGCDLSTLAYSMEFVSAARIA